MANLSMKLSTLLLIIVGLLTILLSLPFNAIYVTYTGLGILFWGIILVSIMKTNPSTMQNEIEREIENMPKRYNSADTNKNGRKIEYENLICENGRTPNSTKIRLNDFRLNENLSFTEEMLNNNEYQSVDKPFNIIDNGFRKRDALTQEERKNSVYQAVNHFPEKNVIHASLQTPIPPTRLLTMMKER